MAEINIENLVYEKREVGKTIASYILNFYNKFNFKIQFKDFIYLEFYFRRKTKENRILGFKNQWKEKINSRQ